MERSINWTSTGYTTYIPLGDKTFLRPNIDKTYGFLKPNIRPLKQTRAVALTVRLEHWTPKGDGKVTGNKKRKVEKILKSPSI